MQLDSILMQQQDYYRARAAEYDEWWERRGRYDRGPAWNKLWFDEVAVLEAAVRALGPVDEALELAPGTGIWTKELAKLARHVTAIDGSEEMLAINRVKVGSDNVEYRQADLFAWEPESEYDLVFFSFWLSHVPPELLDNFLAKVARATRPGGRVFLIDSRSEPRSKAIDNPAHEADSVYERRKLNDGSEYQIVKVFYEPEPLREALSRAGFDAKVHLTKTSFIYASAGKV